MIFYTELDAIDPADGQMKCWAGPEIECDSLAEAQEVCRLNGLGYLRIVGRKVAEIDCYPDTYDPDWSTKQGFDFQKN